MHGNYPLYDSDSRPIASSSELATKPFLATGILTGNVGNDISEVFECLIKNLDHGHADNYRRARVTVSLTICRASSNK
jgi:hypothetical protein